MAAAPKIPDDGGIHPDEAFIQHGNYGNNGIHK